VKRPAAALALLAPLVLACGLPSDSVERAREIDRAIEAQAERLDEVERGVDRMLATDEFSFARPYAEREDWWRWARDAKSAVADVRARYDREVLPLLEADRSEDQQALEEQLARLRARLARIRRTGGEALARAEALRDARDQGRELVRAAREDLERLRVEAASLKERLSEVADDFPAKADDLRAGEAVVDERLANASRGLETAERELARGDEADLAALADGLSTVANEAALARRFDEDARSSTAELYRSYSKTLVDMKEELEVQIGRTSWNNFYDFPAEHEYVYPARRVEPEVLEVLEAWGDRPLVARNRIQIDPDVWRALAIDPRENLPRGDDAAEFWVADTGARYFHKYMLVEGSERTETEWEQVDEDFFEQHIDDLGMDIVSKPYGVYEDEALTQAMPPGYAYVGDERYGEWKQDQGGRRYWSWGEGFLWYYLLFGGNRHYYYYDDWRGWNRNYRGRRAWYGGAGGTGRYGTFGSATRNSSRYAGSRWARSGGFDRQDRSIRGAAAAGRGGGPGGRGK